MTDSRRQFFAAVKKSEFQGLDLTFTTAATIKGINQSDAFGISNQIRTKPVRSSGSGNHI
jgi:hypothetical protein